MRDDPIVHEDWKVGYSKFINNKWLFNLDFAISTFLVLLLIGLSFQLFNLFSVFIWSFSFVAIFLTEVLLNQNRRSLLDRLLLLVGVYLLTLITLPTDIYGLFPLRTYILVILLTTKLVLIPLIEINKLYSQEILVPNNVNVKMVLDEHVLILSETNYKLESRNEVRKVIIKVIIRITSTFLIGFLVISLLFLIIHPIDPQTFTIISSILLYIPGLTFFGIGAIWFYNYKKTTGKSQEYKEKMPAPVFPRTQSYIKQGKDNFED